MPIILRVTLRSDIIFETFYWKFSGLQT